METFLLLDTPSGAVRTPVPGAPLEWRRGEDAFAVLPRPPASVASPLLYDLRALAQTGAINADGTVRVVVRGALGPLPDVVRPVASRLPAEYAMLDAPLAAALALAEAPGVLSVEPALVLRPRLAESVPLVGAPEAWSRGADGAGVTIAIIDTGVDYLHPDLGGCLGATCKVKGGYDFVNGDADPADDSGHGTHVAATAAGVQGVAPGASILAFKVCDGGGSCPGDAIVAGIRAAVAAGADVISMSLGANVNGDGTDYLSREVDAARDAGVTVVVAAGNAGPGPHTVGIPAAARGAIAVGATTKQDAAASFSSRGPTGDLRLKPDIAAPGVGILAAIPGGHRAAFSGTSMATPHVSGAVALLLQAEPTWGPEDVRAALAAGARDLGLDAPTQGHGVLDVVGALDAGLVSIPPRADLGSLEGASFVDATVRIVNRGSQARTVHAEAPALPAGLGLLVDPASFALAPGAAQDVRVRVSFLDDTPFPFQTLGLAFADDEGARVRVPIAFARPIALEVDVGDRNLSWACALHRDGLDVACSHLSWGQNRTTLRLYAPGDYDVVARAGGINRATHRSWNGSLLIREHVAVPETRVVPFAVDLEHRPVEWVALREDGTRAEDVVSSGFHYLARYSPHPDVAMLHFGAWDYGDLHLTPAGPALDMLVRAQFHERGSLTFHDWNARYHGVPDLPTVPLAPDASRYVATSVEAPDDPGSWLAGTCTWFPLGPSVRFGSCGGFAAFATITSPGTHRFATMPIDAHLDPWPEHFPGFEFATDTRANWYATLAPLWSGGVTKVIGPRFRVHEGFGMPEIHFATSPLAWTGKLSWDIVSNADESRWDVYWFTTPGGGLLEGDAAGAWCGDLAMRYRVVGAAGTREGAFVPHKDEWACFVDDRHWVEIDAWGPRQVLIAPDRFTRGGVDVLVNLTQNVDWTAADHDTPFATRAALRNAEGRLVERLLENESATYTLRVGDQTSPVTSAHAWLRPTGRNGTDWTPLPTTLAGDEATVSIAGLATGAYAMRVRLDDASGNAAQWDVDPALRVGELALPRSFEVHHPGALGLPTQCDWHLGALCPLVAGPLGTRIDVRGLAGHRYSVDWVDDVPEIETSNSRSDLTNTDVEVCFFDAADRLVRACDRHSWWDEHFNQQPIVGVPSGAVSAIVASREHGATIELTVHADRIPLPQSEVPWT